MTLGRYFFSVSQTVWAGIMIASFFNVDQLAVIYGLCVSIGMMLISNRAIEDEKKA